MLKQTNRRNFNNLNFENLTDEEISAAIRYLDRHGSSDGRLCESDSSVVLICASLVFLLSSAAFICLYYHIS
jgi:hypothetical protein